MEDKVEKLKTLYKTDEIQNEITIQGEATKFIRSLIEMYVENSSKNDITYFIDLVKLSINYSIDEKKKILIKAGVTDAFIEEKVDRFHEELTKYDSKHDWKNGSLVGTAILRALGNIDEKTDLKNFIDELRKLLEFLIEERSKEEAQEKLRKLIDNFDDIFFITFNSLGTLIHPLCPEAFPLINNHVLVGYDYCKIEINNKDTENYLAAAERLEKILNDIGIPKNEFNFGIIDRLFSEMASENDRKLQTLYNDLIVKKSSELGNYSNDIKDIYEKVAAERERLKTPNELVNSDFVSDLFIGEGVASKGQSLSTIPEGTFSKVLENDSFLSLVSSMIQEPNSNSYSAIENNWNSFFPNNNPQLINRAIAACTKDVSVLVNKKSFKLVLDYLQDEEIITEIPKECDNWFEQNTWLMEELRTKLEVFYSDGLDQVWLNMFPWYLYEYITKVVPITDEDSPNVILYGAPGTGKTHYVNDMLDKICKGDSSQYEILQFHPSYTYEDFIEGIKPQGVTDDGKIKFGLVNGHFKSFCIKAKKEYEAVLVRNINKKEKDKEKPKNFYFVVDEINRANLSAVFGETLSLLEKDYRHNPQEDNGKKNLIKTQYASMGTESDAYVQIEGEAYFGVPKNVYFIGMMNDVDKSIDTFDLALRRRFKWIRKDCDYDVIKNNTYFKKDELFDNIDAYARCAENLNNYISETLVLGKSYEFGHSFFMKMSDIAKRKSITDKNLTDLFNLYLRPTLKEYLRAFLPENEIDKKGGELDKALEVFKKGISSSSKKTK